MKLSLAVAKPPNGVAYQTADAVQGRVDLQLEEGLEVPEIRVILQGTAKVTLKPGFNARAQVGDTHKRNTVKLFSISQIVKATRQDAQVHDTEDDSDTGSSRARGLPTSTVSGTFSINFPLRSRCCNAGSNSQAPKQSVCRLPPSTEFSTPGTRVRVTYSVTAVCKRPQGRRSSGYLLSHLLLPRNLAMTRTITYTPLDTEQLVCGPHMPLFPSLSLDTPLDKPTAPGLIRNTAWLPSSALGLDGDHDSTSTSSNNCLPPYSPAMALDVVMPYPPVITPGQPVALGLVLRTPRALLDAAAAHEQHAHLLVTSLTVRLRRQTHGSIGLSERVDDTMWPLWAVHGSVPVLQETMDMNMDGTAARESATTTDDTEDGCKLLLLDIPTSAVVALQNQPGFWTCFASRLYSIEVTLGVALVANTVATGPFGRKKKRTVISETQYTKTATRVMVSDAPPDYEARCGEC